MCCANGYVRKLRFSRPSEMLNLLRWKLQQVFSAVKIKCRSTRRLFAVGGGLGSRLLLVIIPTTLVLCGCEYEFKDESGESSTVVLLKNVPSVSGEQGEAQVAKQPVQSPDVRPTLAPGKLVSGDVVTTAKLKRINLASLVEEGVLKVTTDAPGVRDLGNVFDEVETTLSKSEGSNPYIVIFQFDKALLIKGAKVLSTYSDYGWAVELEGSPRLVVDNVIEGQWSEVSWPEGVRTKTVKVQVLRKVRDNYVHLNEIELYE